MILQRLTESNITLNSSMGTFKFKQKVNSPALESETNKKVGLELSFMIKSDAFNLKLHSLNQWAVNAI